MWDAQEVTSRINWRLPFSSDIVTSGLIFHEAVDAWHISFSAFPVGPSCP